MKKIRSTASAPLVSLIIPAHNHTHLLPRVLDSILEQSFKRLEAIIVDDCSDIPCDQVVQAYADKGLDLRLIRCPSRVMTRAARLVGVKAARADIIAFVDADDMLWGTDALAYHVDILQKTGADVVHFSTVLVDADMSRTYAPQHYVPLAPELEGAEIFRRYVLARMPSIPVWAKLYAKSLWLTILPIAEQSAVNRFEDSYLTALLYFHTRRYVGSDRCGYLHHFDRRLERSAGRAVGAYRTLKELVPYFRAQGCPEDVLNLLVREFKERICLYAGRFCQQLTLVDGFGITDEELDAKRHGADPELLLKALLLGNRMNARKLTHCLRTIYSAPE